LLFFSLPLLVFPFILVTCILFYSSLFLSFLFLLLASSRKSLFAQGKRGDRDLDAILLANAKLKSALTDFACLPIAQALSTVNDRRMTLSLSVLLLSLCNISLSLFIFLFPYLCFLEYSQLRSESGDKYQRWSPRSGGNIIGSRLHSFLRLQFFRFFFSPSSFKSIY
jgi:hypothetical protein